MDRLGGGGRHSSLRSMFMRPNYKLGNGSDHNDNTKKYGPFLKILTAGLG